MLLGDSMSHKRLGERCIMCQKLLDKWDNDCLEHDPKKPVCDKCYRLQRLKPIQEEAQRSFYAAKTPEERAKAARELAQATLRLRFG